MVLELLISCCTTVALLSRMIIEGKEWTCLRTHLSSSTTSKLWQNCLSFQLRRNSYFKKTFLSNAPIRQIGIAMDTNTAFSRPFTENPFGYQQFDLRQFRTLRGRQPVADFDSANNWGLFVRTMKTMNFRNDIPSICGWRNWCVWKECLKRTTLLSNQVHSATHASVLWFIPLTLCSNSSWWDFSHYKAQLRKKQGEDWVMIGNCILQTLLKSKDKVPSSNTSSRWCQDYYWSIPVLTVSTLYMQLFISSCSDKKKLLEFMMLMYFHL